MIFPRVTAVFGSIVTALVVSMTVDDHHLVTYWMDGHRHTAPFSIWHSNDNQGGATVCFEQGCVDGGSDNFALGGGDPDSLVLLRWVASGVADKKTVSQRPFGEGVVITIGETINTDGGFSFDQPGQFMGQEFSIDYDDTRTVTVPPLLYLWLEEYMDPTCNDLSPTMEVLIGSTKVPISLGDFVIRDECRLEPVAGDRLLILALRRLHIVQLDFENRRGLVRRPLAAVLTMSDLVVYGGGAIGCMIVLLFAMFAMKSSRHSLKLADEERNEGK